MLTVSDFVKNFKSLYISSFDQMLGYQKSGNLTIEEGMKIVACGAFNRNYGGGSTPVAR